MPEYSFGPALVCDAVYKDQATNKAVLAGVYSGYMIAEQFPIVLPLAAYIEVISSEGGEFDVEIRFMVNRIQAATMNLDIQRAEPGVPALVLLQPIPLTITVPGSIELQVRANKGRYKTVLRKEVVLRRTSAWPPS